MVVLTLENDHVLGKFKMLKTYPELLYTCLLSETTLKYKSIIMFCLIVNVLFSFC